MKLFLDNCGALEENELLDLILLDKDYDYYKWTKRECDRPPVGVVSEELKSIMKRRIKNTSLLYEMLEMHDIFNHMLGNPTSITMLAHIH